MTRSSSPTLIEFSFVSKLSPAIPVAALTRLVRRAWRDNMESGLTGEMEIRGDGVRQVLEGDVEAVLPLASRILSDPRHTGIEVLAFRPLDERRHRGWRVYGLPTRQAASDEAGESVVALRPAALEPRRSGDAPASRASHA